MHLYYLLSLIMVPFSACQLPSFFTGPGLYTANSCPTTSCVRCGVGFYRRGCTNANEGFCQACTGVLPANAEWVTDGGFSVNAADNLCISECKAAYEWFNGICRVKADSVYVVEISISLPLSCNDLVDKKEDVIGAFSLLSNCGMCGPHSENPVVCERCRIFVTCSQTLARRLLAPTSTLSFSLTQLNGAAQATLTASALTESNINAQLASKSIPASAVIQTASIEVKPAPVLPPAPSPTPPPNPGDTTAEGNSGSNVGVIAGAVVGGVLVSVAGAVTAFCFIGAKRPVVTGARNKASDNKDNGNGEPSASDDKVKSRFNLRQTQMMSRVKLSAPVNFQCPPQSTIFVMGPMYTPPVRTKIR